MDFAAQFKHAEDDAVPILRRISRAEPVYCRRDKRQGGIIVVFPTKPTGSSRTVYTVTQEGEQHLHTVRNAALLDSDEYVPCTMRRRLRDGGYLLVPGDTDAYRRQRAPEEFSKA